jgi:hypothetical protein
MRRLIDLASTITDYTIGTAIVLVHVLIATRLTRAMP